MMVWTTAYLLKSPRLLLFTPGVLAHVILDLISMIKRQLFKI
jgi:hypothetical protein